MFSALDFSDEDIPEIDISEQRVSELLGDIKRNSRNRRIFMVAPVVLAAAVLGAMIAAPPQHGGVALADADSANPELPQVFGSNGVWRLAEPIAEDVTADPGPAAVVEVPTEPAAPRFVLTPPDQQDLQSLPTSTSTPPMSTSGQSLVNPSVEAALLPDSADSAVDPAELDWSTFPIRVAPQLPVESIVAGDTDLGDTTGRADGVAIDAIESSQASDSISSAPASAVAEEATSAPDSSSPDEVVPVPAEANPSTSQLEQSEAESQAFSTPASIVPQSVLVSSAHVSVTVQVVDGDSSVIDWCNTRVDWGDGSVTRVAGVDDAASCTATCEYEATSSDAGTILDPGAGGVESGLVDIDAGGAGLEDKAFGNPPGFIDTVIEFKHEYATTIDATPRIFVATGDGCSYTLAELQLPTFTVAVPTY